MSVTPVTLTPSPGFCIKSTTLEPGLLPPPLPSPASPSSTKPDFITAKNPSHGGLLEPAPQPTPVPKGMKVFVNICYDKRVPGPPDAPEEVIERALEGDDDNDAGGNAEGSGEWYVPVVVSEPRTDKDKAGKPSLVVDCVYHSEVRKRMLRDPKFKVYLVELALQRIESQTGLTLSRQIGTPNIASKGPLDSRVVRIPTALLLKGANELDEKAQTDAERAIVGLARDAGKRPTTEAVDAIISGGAMKNLELGDSDGTKEDKKASLSPAPPKRALIQELDDHPSASKPPPAQPKGILKTPKGGEGSSLSKKTGVAPAPLSEKERQKEKTLMMPLDVSWTWDKTEDGRLRFSISIPDLDATTITSGHTVLDVEPHRIIVSLTSPTTNDTKTIDIDRTLSDAQLVTKIQERARINASRVAKAYLAQSFDESSEQETAKCKVDAEEAREGILLEGDREVARMVALKREREFDVEGAKAQWVVAERRLVLVV